MISIDKKNEVHMLVQSEPGVEQELSEYFTFFVPGYRFMPAFKSKMWDGKIRLYNLRSKELYNGLIDHVIKFARDREYKIEYKSFPRILNKYDKGDYERFVNSLVLNIKGIIGKNINECNEILFTELLMSRMLHTLKPAEIVCVLCVFIEEKGDDIYLSDLDIPEVCIKTIYT